MKAILLMVGFALTLSGCDAALNQAAEMSNANEPTLVFTPGYQIAIDGKPVPIFGFDECPKQDAVMATLFGPDPLADSHACIVLGKDRQSVAVLVGLPNGRVTEQWSIVREPGKIGLHSRTSLRRPDGSLVVPAA